MSDEHKPKTLLGADLAPRPTTPGWRAIMDPAQHQKMQHVARGFFAIDEPVRVEVSRAYECELDPWTARERAVEELVGRGFYRESAEAALGLVIDYAKWDELCADADRLFGSDRRLTRRSSWVPPRGKTRRSRQLRSTRARARRRVEAREQRRAS